MRAGTPAWPGTTLERPAALERCWWRVCFISYWLFPLVFKTLVMEWLAGNRTSSMKLIMKYITVLCSCQFDRHVSHPWFCQCEQLFRSWAAAAVQQRREIFYSSVFFSPKKKKICQGHFFQMLFFSPFPLGVMMFAVWGRRKVLFCSTSWHCDCSAVNYSWLIHVSKT